MTKPVCFMVMPFGRKPTMVDVDKGPAKVDFDALWDKVLEPVLRELGYEPVRADKDLGALIIKEMIERLTLADLVVADVTLPNANVYYEIGVRHAAKPSGCVLISADWSRQVFDVDQMRQVRYPLPEGEVTDDTAAAIHDKLKAAVDKLAQGTSPVFDAVPGFPDRLDPASATSFREFVAELSGFQAKVRAVREAAQHARREQAIALQDEYTGLPVVAPAVAVELMRLLRDCTDWVTTLAYIGGLPAPIRQLPIVEEQRCLAVSGAGDPAQAVGLLEQLIDHSGDSSERRGLLGGRYKRLHDQVTDPLDKARYLDLAIENYERGMYLDLNDYFPSCNLPRLYRTRSDDGDEDRAHMAATLALAACERARTLGRGDEWLKPTLLGAAFDAADVAAAKRLYQDVLKEGHAEWKLETTIKDLERSVELVTDKDRRAELRGILDRLRALVGQ